MIYPNKIALVIREDLLPWQKLNVSAFLASAIAIAIPNTHGRPFVNKSGTYLPFIKHPMLIYSAPTAERINRAFMRAKERELQIAIYTKPLFATKGEEENLQEIAKYSDEDQDLVGIAIYGENKKVDKALDGLKLHS
jgi:hypothetical protein